MRVDPQPFGAMNWSLERAPRFVVQIIYPTSSPSFTSVAGISGVPGTVINGVVKSISGQSSKIVPEEGRATIGNLEILLVDPDDQAITDELRDQLIGFAPALGHGARDKEVRVFVGYTDVFTDFVRVATMYVDGIAYSNSQYRISTRDKTRELRTQICTAKTTRISADVLIDDATINVISTSDFSMIPHGTSFSDAPSATVGYLLIEKTKEIIRYTGKTGTTFTGCTRGVLSTRAAPIPFDTDATRDNWVEARELIYLELPGPLMAIALMTGIIDVGSGTPELPDHWHMGIAWSDLVQTSFTEVGEDLFDPADLAVGFPIRFVNLDDEEGKSFLEKEVLSLIGCYLATLTTGTLALRRITRVLADQGYVAILNESNVISHRDLVYDHNAVRNSFRVDYNETDGELIRSVVVVDQPSIEVHGIAPQEVKKFRGLHTARHTERAIRERLTVLRDRYAEPPLRLGLTAAGYLNGLEIGDNVLVLLPSLRDHTLNGANLERTFEVQQVSLDWINGTVQLDLFASARTLPSQTLNDDGDPPVVDSYYASGTNMAGLTGYVAASGGNPARLTANVTLTGNAELRHIDSVWRHDGDLKIDSGVTVTINVHAQWRIKGFLQIDGTIDGVGKGGGARGVDPDTVGVVSSGWDNPGAKGWLGPTRASDGVWHFSYNSLFDTDRHTNIVGSYTAGDHTAAPPLALYTTPSGVFGFPAKLWGTTGGAGGQVTDLGDPGFGTVKAKGGTGGYGGAGLLIVCRGLGFGTSGKINLSGTDGEVGQKTSGYFPNVQTESGTNGMSPDWPFQAGSGAGGMPGALHVLLDGDDVPYPDINSNTFVAIRGTSPIVATLPTRLETTGLFDIPFEYPRLIYGVSGDGNAGGSPYTYLTGWNRDTHFGPQKNLWNPAHYVQYIPAMPVVQEDAIQPPTLLTTESNVGFVAVKFEYPADVRVVHVEVWAGTSISRAFAELIGTTATSSFIHSLPSGGTYRYWIRSRAIDGRVSTWLPVGAVGGYPGTAIASGIEVIATRTIGYWAGDGVTSPPTWEPSGTTSVVTCTVKQLGAVIATETVTVTRDSAGMLTRSTTGDHANITFTAPAGPVAAMDFVFTHTVSGIQAQTSVIAVVAGNPAGTPGADGTNTATLTAYKRSVSSPGDNPGSLTYTFSPPGWTPGNGWSTGFPSGTDPIWAVSATAYGTGSTDSIDSGDWSAPVKISEGGAGADGLNVATAYVYQRTNTDSAPSLPSATVTYTFATGGMTGLNNGWTKTIPAFTGSNHYLWVTLATASNTTATDAIASGEWQAAVRLSADGVDGDPGPPGWLNLAVRYPYKTFSTVQTPYMFVHGFDSVGDPADVDGTIWYNTAQLSIPKGTLKAQAFSTEDGYIAFDANLSSPPKFPGNGSEAGVTNYHLGLVKRFRDGWKYDANGTWTAFTPGSEMVIIGSYSRDSIIRMAMAFGNALTIGSIPVERGHVVEPGDIDPGAITSITQFASALRPIYVGPTAPVSPPPTAGDHWFKTGDGKLYRYASGVWTVAVAGGDVIAGSITATQIGTDAVTAPKILANAVTSDKILANAIIAGKIAAGVVGTTELAAKAITAGKIAVTSAGAALNNDPAMSDLQAWWAGYTSNNDYLTLYPTRFSIPPVPSPDISPVGGTVLRMTQETVGAAQSVKIYSYYIPFDNSRKYRVSCWVRRTFPVTPDENTNTQYLLVEFKKFDLTHIEGVGGLGWLSAGTHQYWGIANGQIPATWTRYEQVFGPGTGVQFPNGAKFMQIGVLIYNTKSGYVTLEVQDLRVEEVIPGVLISDGAITAEKVAANAITADKIEAEAITAGKIAANAITASNIQAESITGDKLDASLVLAGKIQTRVAPFYRVEIEDTLSGSPPTTLPFWIGNSGKTLANAKLAFDSSTNTLWVRGTIDASTMQASAITGGTITSAELTTTKIVANDTGAQVVKTGATTDAPLQICDIDYKKGDRTITTSYAVQAGPLSLFHPTYSTGFDDRRLQSVQEVFLVEVDVMIQNTSGSVNTFDLKLQRAYDGDAYADVAETYIKSDRAFAAGETRTWFLAGAYKAKASGWTDAVRLQLLAKGTLAGFVIGGIRVRVSVQNIGATATHVAPYVLV